MKIEITIDGSEPYYHTLKKGQTVIGSSKDCDISLVAEGVSRKHLQVTQEGDQFFVVDQGSANGTFVNDERLVPGQRVEFTSFFPVRLAASVTLALLSDEEASTDKKFDFASSLPKEPTSPATAVATAGTRTRMAVGATTFNPGAGERKAPAKGKPGKVPKATAEDPSARKGKMLAAVVLIGGVAAFFLTRGPSVTEAEAPVAMDPPAVVAPPVKIDEPLNVFAPENYRSFHKLGEAPKCQSATEVSWCQALQLPVAGHSTSGVSADDTTIGLVVPYLSTTELQAAFEPDFKWSEGKIMLPEDLDPREQIILHLLRLPVEPWADFNEQRRWLFVAFLNRAGEAELFVADGMALRLELAGSNRTHYLNSVRTLPGRALAPLAGHFRLAD